MSRKRIAATILLVLGLLPAGADVSGAAPPAAVAAQQVEQSRTVTLPTGDQVLATAAGTVVRPGPGRERLTVADYRVDGRHYVVPRDAALPAGAGDVVDPAAYEVTGKAADMTAAPAEHHVTMTFVDRAGQAANRAEAVLVSLDTGMYWFVDGAGGTAAVRLPAGRYTLAATVYTDGATTAASLLVQPSLDVTGDTALPFDARVAQPIDVRVPHASARPAAVVVRSEHRYDTETGPAVFDAALTSHHADTLSTAHLGPDVAGFRAVVKVNLADPGPAGDFAGSPYQYSLLWGREGRMWTGLRERLTDHRGLATVRAEHATLGGVDDAVTATFGWDAGVSSDLAVSVPITLPHNRIEYYSTGSARWSKMLCHYPPDQPEPEFVTCLSQSPDITYQPGASHRQRWNTAPFTPAARLVERLGDAIRVIPAFTDAAGHAGGLPGIGARTGRLVLYRDGVRIGETGLDYPVFTDLPPEPARYRLEVEATFDAPLPAMSFRAAWTFTSGHTPVGEGLLPVTNVWLSPELDAHNRAPAGRPLAVPIRVDQKWDVPTEPAMDVSYDGGTTWRPATVTPARGGWRTVLTPPRDADHVSVRTRTTDAAGNTSEQTVVHAWELTH